MPTNRSAVAAVIAEKYPVAAQSLLRPLLDLLTVARYACGGDVDKFMVILVIAIRTTEHPLFSTFTQDQLLSGEIPVFPTLGTNVQSIADSTGLPRESVRRKVCQLIEVGWVVRSENELQFTAGGYQQLAGVRVAIEQVAARNFEVVSELLRTADLRPEG
jgi:hypothetical protein